MIDENSFWGMPEDWPRDTSAMIFLARAVEQIGRGWFGTDWTGQECCTALLSSIDPFNSRSNRRVNNTLAEFCPESGRRHFSDKVSLAPPPSSTRGGPSPRNNGFDLSFSQADLVTANKCIEEHNKVAGPAVDRFHQARRRVAELAEADKLSTAYRPLEGGAFNMIPSTWWNMERIAERFLRCQIDPLKPFDPAGGSAWIFVTQDSISKCIATADPPKPRTGGAPELYDWMEGKLFFQKLMQEKGDFKDPLNKVHGWRSQNDAALMIMEHMEKFDGKEPGSSSMKAKLAAWLKEWRAAKNPS